MEEKLVDILVELCSDDIVRENREVELFESGLLDSLAFAELLFDIEEQFGVIISPSEISREQFNTPNMIINEIQKGLNNEKR